MKPADESEIVAHLAKQKAAAEPRIAEVEPQEVFALRDMPAEVLDGWLGEVCREHMRDLPVAFAWPALLAAASVLVDRRYEKTRANLYVALVGPLGAAKSKAIELALELLGVASPTLMNLVAGSAEGLMKTAEIKDANGDPRLYSPDELGHLLEKMRIQNASYAFVLNRAFYNSKFRVVMGQGKEAVFNAQLSIVGGVVDERFQDLFSDVTVGGLYDRFILGLCPDGFVFDYREYDVKSLETGGETGRPVHVRIDPSVWDALKDWHKAFTDRVPELALRVAVICAALDRRRVLTADDLGPARAFAEYQQRIRHVLKPNPGKNTDGILGHRILEYLKRKPGEWINRRTMFKDSRCYDLGLPAAERVLDKLEANGDVEIIRGKGPTPTLVRLIVDPTEEGEI